MPEIPAARNLAAQGNPNFYDAGGLIWGRAPSHRTGVVQYET
jgi:hypothetical protein